MLVGRRGRLHALRALCDAGALRRLGLAPVSSIHVGEGLHSSSDFGSRGRRCRRRIHVGDAQLPFGPLRLEPPAGGAICELLAPLGLKLGAVVPVVDPRRLAVEARVVEDAVVAATDAVARDCAPDEVVVLRRVDEELLKLPRRPDGVAQLDRLRRVAVARLEARRGATARRSWCPQPRERAAAGVERLAARNLEAPRLRGSARAPRRSSARAQNAASAAGAAAVAHNRVELVVVGTRRVEVVAIVVLLRHRHPQPAVAANPVPRPERGELVFGDGERHRRLGHRVEEEVAVVGRVVSAACQSERACPPL